MLILSRYIGQVIKIGDDVEVAVLGLNGNQVRLGIQAPDDVAVHREEIYERVKKGLSPEPKTDRETKAVVPCSEPVTGSIVSINYERGFGFVRPHNHESYDTNLFFHATSIDVGDFDDLEEGLPVEFQIENGRKGPAAVNVSVKNALAVQAR